MFDTLVLNSQVIDPPRTQVPSAATLSGVEIQAGETLYLGSGDISNGFYGMAIPHSPGSRFTLPTVRASYIEAQHFSGIDVLAGEAVIPCLTTLPMGWSRSLHY